MMEKDNLKTAIIVSSITLCGIIVENGRRNSKL